MQSFFIINFNLVIFMKIISFFKNLFRPVMTNLDLEHLDLNVEPSTFSPFSVWQKWIEQADWQKVYKCWQHVADYTDDWGYPIYYGRVLELMEERLSQIQRPVLPDMFFEKHHNIVVAKSGSAREDILHSVSLQMTRKMRPQFVVDNTHKLIGFALSPQLIIAGVSALGVWPSNAAAIVEKKGFSFLSQSEAMCVTRRKDLLNEMMKEAGVPDISLLKGFPLGAVGDDYVTDIWNFVPDKSGKHLRCDKSREMRFLAKI